jgi:anti-sigma B factor antagonist
MAMPAPHERISPTPAQGIRQVVITLPEEIDMTNTSQVHDTLVRALDDGTAVLIADASRTMFCDSATITTLLRAHNRAAATGAQLRIAASPPIRRILELTGADRILHVYRTVAAALAAPPHSNGQASAFPLSPDGMADPAIQ